MRDLPTTYRQAVELSELEGVPQAEVAHRLGLSLSGAKSRVQGGRDKLKDLLLECCHFQRDPRGNAIALQQIGDCRCCGDGPDRSCC